MLCWANNDGACGRRCPCWRRCCVVLGDVVVPLRRRVAVDVYNVCSHCIGRRPLVWLTPLLWFHPISAARGGSSLLGCGSCLWGGAEAKASQADTSSDAVSLLGGIICLPLPPPRPMAGRLAGGSSSVPASLHSTHCRLDCLGRGGCFAAMSPCFISGGCFAAVFMLLGGCFATGSCFELGRCFVVVLLWRMLCRRGRTFR